MSSRTRKLGIRHGDARLDPRWNAVAARDPRADGRFVYAVRTTGVYARPSSSARLPNPANVEFFDTAAAAEAAGYRPSRRVAGDRTTVAARHAARVTGACRRIEFAMDTADRMLEHPEFYFVVQHDFRLRRYFASAGSVRRITG